MARTLGTVLSSKLIGWSGRETVVSGQHLINFGMREMQQQ